MISIPIYIIITNYFQDLSLVEKLARQRYHTFFVLLHLSDVNHFLHIYCRENANESRFENCRGKICPFFAHLCIRLTVSLLSQNIRLSHRKYKC